MDAGAPRLCNRPTARWRPALRIWHRWFGLGASVWLVLLALSGCGIAWYDTLDAWLNPELRRIASTEVLPAREIPLAHALDEARRALPGFEPRQVQLPHAGGTLWMIGRADGVPIQLFADPRDGHVLGWRESGRPAVDRRHLMDLLYALHTDLLLGPWMTTLLGLVSLLWLIDHALALALAIPQPARWREAFALGGVAGSGRRRFDWHRAPAMWALPLTLVMALTGVTLAWPDASRDAVRLLSPVGERLDVDLPDRDHMPAVIDVDRAIAIAAGDAPVHSVRLLPHKQAYAVRTFDPRDVDDQGRLWTYVSMQDGRLLGQRHDVGDSAGDMFFAWQYALHSGRAFGAPGQWLVVVAGVATIASCITGVLLWWRRRRRSQH